MLLVGCFDAGQALRKASVALAAMVPAAHGAGCLQVTIETVGENLAQLMYSVMMTGYMFRNAQYRMELRQTLAALPAGACCALCGCSQISICRFFKGP